MPDVSGLAISFPFYVVVVVVVVVVVGVVVVVVVLFWNSEKTLKV